MFEPSEWRRFERSKIGEMPCVQDVKRLLWEHARSLYGAFDYYASDPTCKATTLGEPDIFNIQFNGFVMFTRDCSLTNRAAGYTEGHLETAFVTVDATESGPKLAGDEHNKRKALNRHEWLQVVVRIAMRKYLPTGPSGMLRGDTAAALARLLTEDLVARLPAEAVQNRDAFRQRRCYTRGVDEALARRLSTLRALYTEYSAEANRAIQHTYVLADVRLMSVGEWLRLLEHLQLFEMQLISVHAAKRIFLLSRLRSVPDHTDASEVRMRHLLFEDFLEALVRVACFVALPTSEEVHASGLSDAGELLTSMFAHHPDEFASFISERAADWRSWERPSQQVHECVDHLLSFILVQVDRGIGTLRGKGIRLGDGVVSDAEAHAYLKQRVAGVSMTAATVGALSGDEMLSVLETVAARVRRALQGVAAFSQLSEAQLETLRCAMSVATFDAGECVFNQGDIGDQFYAITAGEAVVLRADPDNLEGDEIELVHLAEGACFGERALLRNDVRFASIVATTRLYTLSIDRLHFEAALGRLESLVPDTYDK